MLELPGIHELATVLCTGVRLLAQTRKTIEDYEAEWDTQTLPEPEPLPVGVLVVGALILVGFNLLFAFWGKSRAEKHNVDPWIGFAMGFALQFIGVAMVPVFRKDRVVNIPKAPPLQAMNTPNPMYAPPMPMHAPNPMYAPSVQAPAYPPPEYPQPMPAPLPPQPPPPQMLVADASGHVNCPVCAARTKAGRKTCMGCGNSLPAVYNPHIK